MRSCCGIPPRRSTRRICSRLDALVTIIPIRSFHLRSSWIINPRTLCDDTHSKTRSPTRNFSRSGLFRKKQICISLHFFAFNFIRLLDAHTTPFLDRPSERVTSSTNFQMPDFPELHCKSLTIIKNRIGPNFVPWGTPALAGSQIETASPSLTHCLRPDRKLTIHGIKDRLTPMSISFWIRILWPIRSKAFEKSKRHMRRK